MNTNTYTSNEITIFLVYGFPARALCSSITCHYYVGWLEDAAYFAAIDNTLNTFSWYDWPEPLKNRHLVALEEIYQSEKEFVISLES